MIVAVVLQALVALLLLVVRLFGRTTPASVGPRPLLVRARTPGGPRSGVRFHALTAVLGAASAAGMLVGVLPSGPVVFWITLLATVAAGVVALVAFLAGRRRVSS